MPGPNRLCRGALANWYLLSTDSLRDFPYLCSDNSYGEGCNLISRRESHDWQEDATWPNNARATAPSRGRERSPVCCQPLHGAVEGSLARMSWSVTGVSGLCRRADQHNPDSHPLCKAGHCHRKGTWLGSHRTVFKSRPDTSEPEGEKNKGTACKQGPA